MGALDGKVAVVTGARGLTARTLRKMTLEVLCKPEPRRAVLSINGKHVFAEEMCESHERAPWLESTDPSTSSPSARTFEVADRT